MALVIANPACCCAFTSDSEVSEQIVKSCCPQKEGNKQHKSCACSIDKTKSSPEVDLNLPAPASIVLPLSASPSTEVFLPTLPEAVAFIAKWPPGRLPVATTRSRLAGKCSYLI